MESIHVTPSIGTLSGENLILIRPGVTDPILSEVFFDDAKAMITR